MVHVIHGEHPAAMQYGNSSASSLFFQSIFGAFFRRNRNTDTIRMGYHDQLQLEQHHHHHNIGNGNDDDGDNDDDDNNSKSQKFINDIATDDYRSVVPTERRRNKALNRDAASTVAAKQKHRLDYSDRTSTSITTMSTTMVHQVYELLSGQLHIIIHTIYKQFPNTILCWLFHYIIGTVSIHLLLATNNS